ncbi:MAG: hypothetical protein H0T51_14195 [Pirellulales bacterium]|nr:hypothetical protein [Pirellulales bacterium]
MLRLRCERLGRFLGLVLPAAGLIAGAMTPTAAANEPAFRSQSTLDAHVAPQTTHLDAAIASMVSRGIIADIHIVPPARVAATPKPIHAAPAPAARPSTAAAGKTQWRAAGQGGQQAPPAARPVTPPTAPEFPEAPITPTPTEEPAEDAIVEDSVVEESEEGITGPSLAPPTEADALAPIDELSETPAPDTDAPGDPLEPEYTGAAIADDVMPPAKPLSSAPKVGDAALTPIGEPDRLAKPDLTAPPASPESYQEADVAPGPGRPGSLPPLTKNQRALRDKVRRVLKHYYNRPLSTADRSPWEVMHAMLSFEVHSRVLPANRQPITAVGWLCFNQPCENRSLLYLNEDGDMRVKVGPALQGHHGQLLALLAQARVRSDYPMKVQDKDFTVADLIEVEKSTCYPKTELTFKLIGLQRYLDVNARWVNDQGMQWDFPTLVREELRQPVRTAACGGTHRLGGLALAVKKRRASGLPVDGVYAEADKYVANYMNYAYSLQNPDGSFSTEWFKGPGRETDIDRRLKTTGHTLEWLLYAGSEEQLTNYRTVRAVNYLTNIMYSNRTRDWEAGPLGHAIHALVLYDRLAFSKYDGAEPAPSPVAQKAQRPQQRRTKR